MCWYNFCGDVRLEILKFLAYSTICEKGSIVRYACVSREWQVFFETFTFKGVEISPPDIMTFITAFLNLRRRKYLQYIGLRPDLPVHSHIRDPYLGSVKSVNIYRQMQTISYKNSTLYDKFPWLKHQEEENNRAFTIILRGMFVELFQWRTEDCHINGIELEIIADSESQWQKTAKEERARKVPDVIGHRNLYSTLPRNIKIFHAPPYHGLREIHDAELDFHFWLKLDLPFGGKLAPKVDVISSLSILRRSIRHFDPESIAHVISLLPRLRALRWEVRPHAHWSTEHKFHRHFRPVLFALPQAIEKVKIQQQPTSKPLNSPEPSEHLPGLGPRLVLSCPYLTNIYLDIGVDVVTFFDMQNCLQNLQYACIRTDQALLDELPSTSNKLFGRIGKVVSAMSKLRALCVFNTNDSVACMLNCRVVHEGLKVIVKCSWPFHISEDTKACWRRVERYYPDESGWWVQRDLYETIKYQILLQQNWHGSLC